MPVKRLLDSVIAGLGATAGKRLFEELEDRIAPPEETPEEKEKREKKERAARERAEKEAAKAAKAEAAARAKAKAQREADVDRELAALKKRLGK